MSKLDSATATGMPSRRRFLSQAIIGAAAGPAITLAGTPSDASYAGADAEIFALARATREAAERIDPLCELCDEVVAEREGRLVDEEDEDALDAALDDYTDGRRSLYGARPKTIAGVRAMLEHYQKARCPDEDELALLIDSLLKSPALAMKDAS